MNILDLFNPIQAFVFDIDGVLTDGNLLVTEEGVLLRSMSIKDGYALQLAIKKGYPVWIISGGSSHAAKLRLQKLGVEQVFIQVKDKLAILQELSEKSGISLQHILYMGDDMPDLAAMQACGLSCCPADAAGDVRQEAKYISPYPGGRGCVREVIEKVLKINKDWE